MSTLAETITEALFQAKSAATHKQASFTRYDVLKLIEKVIENHEAPANQIPGDLLAVADSHGSDVVKYSATELEALKARFSAFKRFSSVGWRRPTTKWTVREEKALRSIFPYDPTDIESLEAYYSAQPPPAADYRRMNLPTLLNNIPGEIDKAHRWLAQQKQAYVSKDYSKL